MDEATTIDLDVAEIAGCAIRAFMPIPQVDGPPLAYHEQTKHGRTVRYAYQTFAWRHQDKNRLIQQVAGFAASLTGKGIVWRQRPEFSHHNGEYFFACRLHVLPYEVLPGEKPQCQDVPLAAEADAPSAVGSIRLASDGTGGGSFTLYA